MSLLPQQHPSGIRQQCQYCGQLGKQANCQVLVSLTLARREVPVCVGLRPFLPETWARDPDRRLRAGVPLPVEFQPKWRIALEEIDRGRGGVRLCGRRCRIWQGGALPGRSGGARAALRRRHSVDPDGLPRRRHARARSPQPDRSPGQAPGAVARTVAETITALPAHVWRFVSWRTGTKGRLRARFVALRVRVADGARLRTGRRLPGSAAWLVCEQRTPDERRYYLTNHPEDTPLPALAADIKARWVCEQGHQPMKEAERMRSGPRSSGVPELDSSAPPHRPDHDRSVLSPACATWGKKGAETMLGPGHLRSQPCLRSGARS